jgi:hypothetical protein
VTFAFVIVVLPSLAGAQTGEALPEIDAYYTFNPDLRVQFQVKETREGGDPTTAEIGPSLQLYLKKLSKLSDITTFDMDKSKSQLVLFSAGYRILPTPNQPPTNRFEPYIILNLPSPGKLVLSDKNRADLDWQNGSFSWHYRNLINIERPITIHNYHPSPYVSAEFWYTSQYQKWSTTSLFAGCLFPLGRHIELNPYYEHQNNTGKSPNQLLNQLGLMLNLWLHNDRE